MFRWREEGGEEKLPLAARCWFSGGRSVTTAVTVEDWLGVGLAGGADKQPGRRGEGLGRKRKMKGGMEREADERHKLRTGGLVSQDVCPEWRLEAAVLFRFRVSFLPLV